MEKRGKEKKKRFGWSKESKNEKRGNRNMGDMRVGYNVRKKQILELLDGNRMTPREVAEIVGISGGATRHLLSRYHMNGYLLKDIDPRSGRGRHPYIYTLSERGKKLLEEGRIIIKKRRF